MANTNKDIDKILQDIKKRKLGSEGDKTFSANFSLPESKQNTEKLEETIKNLTENKKAQTEKPAMPTVVEKQKPETGKPLEKQKPETEKTTEKHTHSSKKSDKDYDDDILIPSVEHIDSSKIVDDKFVDFFTQSIIVPRQKEEEISIKRKKHSFFKKKYITDSLSLSIPQEEIEKAEKLNSEKRFNAKTAQSKVEGQGINKFFKPKSEDSTVLSRKAQAEDNSKIAYKVQAEDNSQIAYKVQAETKAVTTTKEKTKDDVTVTHLPQTELKKEQPLYTVQAVENKETPEREPLADLSDDKNIEISIQEKFNANRIAKIKTTPIPKLEASVATDEYDKKTDTKMSAEDILARLKRPQSKPTQEKQQVSDVTAMFVSPEAKDDTAREKEKTTYQANADIAKMVSEIQDTQEPPVFEEYTIDNEFSTNFIAEDPVEILDELSGFKSTLAMRVTLSIICSVVLLYLNIGATMGFLPIPEFMSPKTQPLIFYIISLIFYSVAIIGFAPTIIGGFVGLFKTSTSDSFVSLSAVLCLLQLIVAVATADKIATDAITIFAGFLVVALCFNAMGKLICANTISRNLTLADAPDGINAGYVIKDPEDVKRLARTLEEKNLQVLVSRKTGYISNFISGGFSAHRNEKHSKKLSFFTYGVTLICFIISFVLSKSFTTAIFNAAGASVLMLPLSHTLISSVPSSLMQKSLKQVGALVNGWQGIYQISETTHVSFDAKHLFPKGSVVLHGIKTFEKERLDLAILYAASIAIEKCDNLRPAFLNIIENKTDMLLPLESCEYKVGQGYIAWIEHNRIIMGNRNLMSEYNIELPPVSLETKYTSEGKKPIYLSVNGNLFGMFVMSYHADRAVKDNLERLINNGVNVILQSTDFNVDSQLLEIVYDLPQDIVQVLNQNETALLLNYTAYAEKTETAMAHLDSLYSLAAGFYGAESAKTAASTCAIVQTISILIGAGLAVMFSVSQSLPEIPIVSVLLLGAGWMGLCLMRALAKKYY